MDCLLVFVFCFVCCYLVVHHPVLPIGAYSGGADGGKS